MTKQDSYKCSLILAPATIEEVKQFENDLYALCILYKNPKTNKIQIIENQTSLHNIVEKAYFLDLSYVNIDISEIANNRPIYMIDLNKNKTVDEYSLVNGINVELNDILNGTFENIKSDVNMEKIKKFKK